MALTTVNITGTFNFPDATWSQYTKAEFHLSGYDTDTEVVVPKVVSATLGAGGELDVDLWGNDDGLRGTVYRVNVVSYEGSAYNREILRRDLGRIQIVGDGPLDIADLLDIPVTVPEVWYSTITEAEYDAVIDAAAQVAIDAERTETNALSVVDRAWFKEVSDLTGDNNVIIGYTGSGSQFIVDDGDVIEAGGFRYSVLAASAVGEHLTTAGGVKLHVLPADRGYNLLAFDVDETGSTDETASIAVWSALGEIYAPSGTYLCDKVELPANTILYTDGFATKFKQTVSPGVDVRIVNIVGSNVTVEDLSVEGQIDTHTGEQHHGLYIRARAETGAMSNIRVGNVHGENLRGDVVYVGAFLGYPLNDVSVGNITGSNVLRNGVSHTGGNIKCGDVFIDRIGFATVDIEAEPTYEPSFQSHFGRVKGRVVGVVAASASSPAYDAQFQSIDLDPAFVTAPSSAYPIGAGVKDGLLLRNVKSLSIGYFRSTGHERCEAFLTFGAGEIGCENLVIGHLALIGDAAANTDATYPAMMHLQEAQNVSIGTLVASLDGSKQVISFVSRLHIGAVRADLTSDALLCRSTEYVDIGAIEVTGTGRVFQSILGGSVRNGTISCNRLASFCQPMKFSGIAATAAVFLFDTANDNHVVENCTLNGDFYSFGQYVADYTFPMRIGVYRLWVDATGDLRIKSGAAASDTDGTVVGTQT